MAQVEVSLVTLDKNDGDQFEVRAGRYQFFLEENYLYLSDNKKGEVLYDGSLKDLRKLLKKALKAEEKDQTVKVETVGGGEAEAAPFNPIQVFGTGVYPSTNTATAFG